MTSPAFPRVRRKDTSVKDATVGCLIALVAFPLTFALAGFTLMSLWNWFVVPPTGYKELAFWGAVGLSAVVTFFKHGLSTYKEKDPNEASTFVGKMLMIGLTEAAVYAILLLEGWIIHTYLMG